MINRQQLIASPMIRSKRQCIPLLVLLLALSSRALSDDSPPATQPQLSSAPKAVRIYIEGAKRDAMKSVPKMKKDLGNDFVLDFQYNFFAPAIDFRDGHSTAYLLGYTLGIAPDNGLLPIYRTVLVDTLGKKLMETDEGGTSGITLKLQHGMQAAVISGDEGRPHGGYITIMTLERKPRVLLNYHAPDPWMWESTLYFVDDTHGEPMVETDRHIMVERIVRDPETETKWTEYVELYYASSSGVFEEGARLSKNVFEKLLKSYGGKEKVPQVSQSCSYEEAWDKELKVVSAPGEKTP